MSVPHEPPPREHSLGVWRLTHIRAGEGRGGPVQKVNPGRALRRGPGRSCDVTVEMLMLIAPLGFGEQEDCQWRPSTEFSQV